MLILLIISIIFHIFIFPLSARNCAICRHWWNNYCALLLVLVLFAAIPTTTTRVLTMLDLAKVLDLKDERFILATMADTLTQPFCFDQLYHSLLKEGRSMLLVLLAQNLQHYSAVATKCGVNNKYLKPGQRFDVLDFFDCQGTIGDDGLRYDYEWSDFKADLLNRVDKLPERSVVMFDDLSVLLCSLNFSISNVYSLIRLVRRKLFLKEGTLFVGSFYCPEDEQLHAMITTLAHECHLWLACDKPQTGFSMHIHGIAKCYHQMEGAFEVYNYRISNRNVIFNKI